MIFNAQRYGHIVGVRVSSSLNMTHLLFVDDVILFGLGTTKEWQHYKGLLDLFCSATGMKISEEKSSFLYNDIDEFTTANVAALLPYKMEPFSSGFKYLG